MPTIETSREIAADIETVYAQARKVEEFPEYMPDVRSIKVIEESPDGKRTVTEWVGVVEKFNQTVRWTEEDLWDDEAHSCKFRQIKGDYKAYHGEWSFAPTEGGTRFSSRLYFEYDIPLIGALIQGLITQLMKANLENTLKAIGERAEAKARAQAFTGSSAEGGV